MSRVDPARERYAEMQAKVVTREGEAKLATQVELGRQYLADPARWVEDFTRSVQLFAAYSNVDQPFYPEGRDSTLEGHAEADNTGTNQVVSKLIRQRTLGGLTLIDREPRPARTKGRPPVLAPTPGGPTCLR